VESKLGEYPTISFGRFIRDGQRQRPSPACTSRSNLQEKLKNAGANIGVGAFKNTENAITPAGALAT
jgi:hypothetical protein